MASNESDESDCKDWPEEHDKAYKVKGSRYRKSNRSFPAQILVFNGSEYQWYTRKDNDKATIR